LVAAVADVAADGAWQADGAGDLASWLAARWQISVRNARDLVRDAQALAARPALGAALMSGSISVDQCDALTVISDPSSDEVWLENLPYWSYAELEREARKHKARELERKDGGVYLRMEHTADERFLKGVFQLEPSDGAVLIAAIDAVIPSGTALRDYDSAAAVALVDLARGAVCEAERPTVLLAGDVAELSSGGVVGAEAARRLSCDATLAGKPVPASTRRAVEARDNHRCTFPGCHRELYLQCHHIVHRADGGSNDLSNLQLVCWQHHKLIHEGGWALSGEAGPRITWVRPDGTSFRPRIDFDTS
jgi:hypothetical protein